MEYLIQQGADVNKRSLTEGMTPAMIACSHSDGQNACNVVKMLQKAGADLNTCDNNGR